MSIVQSLVPACCVLQITLDKEVLMAAANKHLVASQLATRIKWLEANRHAWLPLLSLCGKLLYKGV